MPVVYSPGGTYTVPPPLAWQASMALCTGAVAFWVRAPVAPWSRTLQAPAGGARVGGSGGAAASVALARTQRKRAVKPALLDTRKPRREVDHSGRRPERQNIVPEMPPIPSRSTRPGGKGPSLAKPIPPQALKILLAGVDKDTRGAVEATVREALGARASSGPWSISVVSFGDKWSVTLDGPGDRFRGLSFVAEPSQLSHAIRQALNGGPGEAAPGTAPDVTPPPSTDVRDAHVCEQCHRAIVVIYELRSGEPKELAPLACPHCWKVGHVEIGAWAAAGGDYRSEKA